MNTVLRDEGSVRALPLLGLLLLVGCSGAGGSGADAGKADSGAPDAGPADAGGSDAGPLDAGTWDGGVGIPVLTSATMMVHGIHQLGWQLPASGCSYVGLSMRVGMVGTSSEVKVVSGTTTATEYSPGHDPGTFCYTTACTLGTLVSGASNELCITQ